MHTRITQFRLYRRGAVAAKSVAASGLEFVSSEWNMAPNSGFCAWSCCVRSFACRAMSAAAPTDGGATFLFFFSGFSSATAPALARFAAFFLAFAAAA